MGAGAQALTEGGALLYCDTSALVRAYMEDEPGHAEMRVLLLESGKTVVTSALAEVEIAAAVAAAVRHGRLDEPDTVLGEVSADTRGGPVVLISLDGRRVLPQARELCARHRLRALDAIHLAVALSDATTLAGDQPVVFVTRDADQAAAAVAEGLRLG